MSPLSVILNVLWVLFGGLWMAVAWLIAAVIMAITIIGIPWARAAFNIASYTLLPFGRVALSREELSGREDLGTGPLGVIGNLIWLLLAGWWLALGHIVTAIGLAITIIGLPFAWAHLKLVPISPLADWQDDRDPGGSGDDAERAPDLTQRYRRNDDVQGRRSTM
jgi:uncharacterized membrane protein YccF (DUF307 family)